MLVFLDDRRKERCRVARENAHERTNRATASADRRYPAARKFRSQPSLPVATTPPGRAASADTAGVRREDRNAALTAGNREDRAGRQPGRSEKATNRFAGAFPAPSETPRGETLQIRKAGEPMERSVNAKILTCRRMQSASATRHFEFSGRRRRKLQTPRVRGGFERPRFPAPGAVPEAEISGERAERPHNSSPSDELAIGATRPSRRSTAVSTPSWLPS